LTHLNAGQSSINAARISPAKSWTSSSDGGGCRPCSTAKSSCTIAVMRLWTRRARRVSGGRIPDGIF
jgi:hypothetical protein